MEIGEMSNYRRHVDDITITFYQNKINTELITNHTNNVHKYLELKTKRRGQQYNLLGTLHP